MTKALEATIEYASADDYFTQKEKQLFLQIPHKKETQGKIEIIDFNVPENGEYPLLSRVKFVQVNENLNENDFNELSYRIALRNTSCYMPDNNIGLYISSNHGAEILYLMQELYEYDQKSAKALLNEYYKNALLSSEIVSMNERFVRQVSIMREYLQKSGTVVEDYKIDYAAYLQLDEEEREKEVKKLYKKHGKRKDFESFNDLDNTPVIVAGEYQIYDSSSATLFVVKEEGNTQTIYEVSADRNITLFDELEDRLNDFAFEHHQRDLLLSRTITDKDLIAEITDGVLTKATVGLTHMDLIQSDIVNDLTEQGKIKNESVEISFEDLLNNYTLQNEYYHIEERALLKLLNDLEIIDNNMTYKDYSKMNLTRKVKHETISEHTIKELIPESCGNEVIDGRRFLNMGSDISIEHLIDLPNKYKMQINNYLDKLLERDNGDNAKKLVSLIKEKTNDGSVLIKNKDTIEEVKLKSNKIK